MIILYIAAILLKIIQMGLLAQIWLWYIQLSDNRHPFNRLLLEAFAL
jgi:hypothetical protein